MTEEPVDQVDDEEDIKLGMSLTMHPGDEFVLATRMLGAKPVIIIELNAEGDPDDPDAEKDLDIKVDCYGIGTSKDDVMQIGNVFWLLAKAIEEKADKAYHVATEEND